MSFVNQNTIEVRDWWVKPDGTAETGEIHFTPSAVLVDTAGKQQISNGTLIVKLDYLGKIAVPLPANDDPDITPAGWVMRVDYRLSGYQGTRYVNVPLAAGGAGIDLPDVPDAVFSGDIKVFDGGSATLPGSVILADGGAS